MFHSLRTRLRRARFLVPAVVCLALVPLTACGTTSAGQVGVPAISGGTELDAAIPPHIANMALENQDGKTVHLADFKGKTLVIQDGMTLCQEQCPIDTATFVAMARQYESTAKNPADTVFLTITVDPVRDVPAQISAYRKLYAPGASDLAQWQVLTGSPENIVALWKYFHVYWEKVPSDGDVKNWRTGETLTYDVQHGDEVFFIDKTFRQRYLLNGMPSLGGTIPATIKNFMGAADGMAGMKMTNWTVADGLKALTWVQGL